MKSLTRFMAHSPASFSDLRASVTARAGTLSPPSRACQVGKGDGSGSFCQRSFTEPVLRLFALLRVTAEGVRMTSLASVILSAAKNLNSCRALARKSQTDPLPRRRMTWVFLPKNDQRIQV